MGDAPGAPPAQQAGWSSTQIWIAIIGALAVIIAAAIPVIARHGGESGVLTGSVRDGDGNPVVAATIQLEQQGTAPRSQVSVSDGGFYFDGVALKAPVTLSIQAQGFVPKTIIAVASHDAFQQQPVILLRQSSTDGVNPDLIATVAEFDNRIAVVQQVQKQLADPTLNHDQRVSVSVIVWRVWSGDHEYKATQPEFNGVPWIGLVAKFRQLSITKDAAQAERAIHAIEQGDPNNVYDADYLETQLSILGGYSHGVLHPAIRQ